MSPAPLLIYDGDCGFCTAAALWIERSWPVVRAGAPRPTAIPFQSLGAAELARLGLTPDEAARAAWWVDGTGGRWPGHLAIGQALAAATGWRRVAGVVVLTPPGRWLGAPVYRLVARYRYRLPGSTASCRVPPAP